MQQCEVGVAWLQELELSGQDSFIAADNTKVLITPIFQGLTFGCMLVIYIMVSTLLTILCFHF
jgi:hypothetical protein